MKAYITILLALAIFASPPCLCDTGVDRVISEVSENEHEVTLIIDNITICGITETLPDDMTYLDTTHPEDAVRVSGQSLSFAVINETSITYHVKSATPDAQTAITGIWIDLLSESGGVVGGGALPAGAEDQASDEAEPPGSTPGFGIGISIVAMIFAALICWKGRS